MFMGDRQGNCDFYTIAANGSSVTQITTDTGVDSNPTFSPDGLLIAFASTRGGQGDVYNIGTDGTGLQKLTNTAEAESV